MNDQPAPVTTEPAPIHNEPTETAQPVEAANNVAPNVPTKSTHKKSKTVKSKYLSAKNKHVKTRDVNSLVSQAVEPINNNVNAEPANNNVSAKATNNNVNAKATKVQRKVCLLMSLYYALHIKVHRKLLRSI